MLMTLSLILKNKMYIYRHKNFKKQYKKLSKKAQYKFTEKLSVFMQDPFAPALNNHSLGGGLSSFRSIDITGDIRAWYKVDGEIITFVKIGTHSELYG